MSGRVAGIDVGTNSLLLLIAERDGPRLRPILDRSDICRLGDGVDRTRRLDDRAIERTLAVLGEYAAACAEHGVRQARAAGTSALRDAVDRDRFLRRARDECGFAIEVISGEREAELTYADVAASFAEPGRPLAMLDIGGGSTELVRGVDGAVAERRSVDIGSNRLTERQPTADPPTAAELAALRTAARAALAEFAPEPGALVGTGGTITTLAAVAQRQWPYDATLIDGSRLTIGEVGELVGRLAGLTVAERSALPGLEPKRAPVILAGAVLLEQAMLQLGAAGLTVGAGGLRFAVARLAAEELAALGDDA